jgi:hypothetical protein
MGNKIFYVIEMKWEFAALICDVQKEENTVQVRFLVSLLGLCDREFKVNEVKRTAN